MNMKLPFSTEEFLNVFGQYNSEVWPIQLILYLLAGIVLLVLFLNYGKQDKVINLVLSLFWFWMGIVYHLIYFSEINPAALLFGGAFIIQALILAYFGILKRQIQYRLDKTVYGITGIIFAVFGLFIYPILSVSSGHIFPKMPTFGLPCPTIIFTIGILLFSINRLPWYIYLIPLLWSLIGISAAITLSIKEDFALGIAGAIGLVYFLAKSKRRSVATAPRIETYK